MKFITLCAKYLSHNFIKLLPFVIIPAILISISYDFSLPLNIFWEIFEGKMPTFEQTYFGFSIIAGNLWWLKLITIVVVVVAMGIVLSAMDRHMRIGKFSFQVLRRLDESIMVMLPTAIICFIITELFCFLSACLVVLISVAFTAPLSGYLVISVCVAMFLLWSWCIVLFINCVPCMLVQGYPFAEALPGSVRLVTKHWMRMFFAFLAPFIILLPAAEFSARYLGWYSVFVVGFFACIFLMYYTSLSMVSYFDLLGYERKDIKYKLFR